MSQTVVLHLPDETIVRYAWGAAAARKPLEEFLADRLNEAAPPYGAVAVKPPADPSRGAVRESPRRLESRSLPNAEARLLQQINTGFDEEEWGVYRALIVKRRAGTLQPDEQQELIRLVDQLAACRRKPVEQWRDWLSRQRQIE